MDKRNPELEVDRLRREIQELYPSMTDHPAGRGKPWTRGERNVYFSELRKEPQLRLSTAMRARLALYPALVDELISALAAQAMYNPRALEILLERTEGKVKDRLEVELTGQVEIKTVEVRLPESKP